VSITTKGPAQTRAYAVLLGLAGALFAAPACVPESADVSATATEGSQSAATKTSGDSASSTSGASATTGGSTATTGGSTSTTGDPSSTSAPATTEEPSCNFLGCDDVPREDPPCDTYSQDCPEGQKCTYNGYPGLHHCVDVPADPQPPGAPCQAEGGLWDGEDNCGVGGVCWHVDERSGEGECVSFCAGSPNRPTCEDPATLCFVGCQDCVGMCIKGCDPLAGECSDGQVCVPQGSTFMCVYDASGELGAYLDPCEYGNACDPGLFCAYPDVVAGCEGDSGCCTPFCDLNDPQCPDALQCDPYFTEPSPGQEHIGLCVNDEP
jgi:hypothetical protein